LHDRGISFLRPKILQLLPDREHVIARQVGDFGGSAEALFAVTMIAGPGEEQPAKGISTGNERERFLSPCDLRRNAGWRFGIFGNNNEPQSERAKEEPRK
jgi:hypothetical protein